MKILILGGDGYLGWPTAMHFAAAGHDVTVVDNYLRRIAAEQTDSIALFQTPMLDERVEVFFQLTGFRIEYMVGDLADSKFAFSVFEKCEPEVVIHYAEQPSAPYSMRGFTEAELTLKNNLQATFNCIWES